jgi:hypothetical protein
MRTCCAIGLLSGLLLAHSAGAEPAPESAEALFVRARTLMKMGDCANALPLLEQSHAIEPTVGARFNMAVCEERLGKLTQALEHLRSVIDASAPDDDRRAHAERALRDLLPRVPYLVLELDDARHALELVRLDGELLPALRVNQPFAINPGPHALEVVLASETPQVRRFSVAERQVYTWSLGGMRAAPIAGSQDTRGPAASDSRASPPAESPERTWTTRRTVAVVAAGTSVAAFGVATGFGLSARSIYDSSDPYCTPDDICQPPGMEKRERARERGTIATIALTVGVASAFAAGTLWFAGAPSSPSRSKPVRVGVHFEGGRAPGAGIVLEGSY